VIRGHIALIRQLRHFVEDSGLSWKNVTIRHERDEEGYILRDDDKAEISFPIDGKLIEVAIFCPSTDGEHRPDGKNILPLGKLSARINGHVTSGPIDQTTWDKIRDVIHAR
jgi:hypothetical protein